MTSLNAKQFRFPSDLSPSSFDDFPPHIPVGDKGIGLDEMKEALLDAGVDKDQLTPAWLENHYRYS